MSSLTPITLVGNKLGERHHHLNTLVFDAYKQNVPFETIVELSENSPIDKLFKIDLACKYRNLDYIMKILTNEDMLYVTRALKSLWLLEPQYSDIINPTNLEGVLYPSMVTTAVNKMRHWLQLHLRGEERCKIFYEYYNKTNFNSAIHFLARCSNAFILVEVNNILHKLTPHYMKLLGEKCPSVAKIYYDSLESRPSYINDYITNEKEFYNSLKCLLKADADMVLDIVEKYFHLYYFSRFSAEATKYIIRNCKNRFVNKIELYTAYFLDIKTLAKYLNREEIKNVILKLACAEYLEHWFNYKTIEPLIKRLDYKERQAFKKQVFIEKNVGKIVKKWPYGTPSTPDLEKDYDRHVFKDNYSYNGLEYLSDVMQQCGGYMPCRKRSMAFQCSLNYSQKCRIKTLLDRLFDQYRFVGFEKTLYELRKRIAAESSSKHREYMLLVLVSKTGGRSEFLYQLLQLLNESSINEPSTVRATIVRSLVKLAAIWRLPDESWNMFLKFSHGLGLDGAKPEAACNEGIHAVVLRDILQNKDPSPPVFKAFFEHFSSFSDYSLNNIEKKYVRERLPRLLLPNAEDNCEQAVEKLSVLLDFSKTHHFAFDKYSDAMKAVEILAHQSPKVTQALLQSLFDYRIGRKQFIKENFEFIHTEASYVNALRHDITLLATCEKFEKLIENDLLKHDKFLQKLALYFNENNGFATKYLAVLDNRVLLKSDIKLARSIAILAGNSVWERITALNSVKTRESKVFAKALQDNVHLAKPLWNIYVVEWRLAGVKATANRVSVCSAISAEENLQRLLEWNKTAKIALVLSERVGKEAAVFESVAATKPTVALKTAMKYFTRRRETIDPRVWLAVKPIIPIYIDRKSRMELFVHFDRIPSVIKADYCMVVYKAFYKVKEGAMKVLFVLESLFSETEETFISEVIERFIHEDLTIGKMSKTDFYFSDCVNLYLRIIAKFLLYCKTEDAQRRRLVTVAEPFFERLEKLWEIKTQTKETKMLYITDFISSLKYNTMFFDNECVSAMPVFEMIIRRLQKFLPIYRYIDIYIQIHLTMLYYKSIRQSVKNYPEIFEDEIRKFREGVDIVGNIFGKYIAHEIEGLMENYFISIKTIYAEVLGNYLALFSYDGRQEFCMSVIKGIAESKKRRALSVVANVQHLQNEFYGTDKEKIINILKEFDDLETNFLLNGLWL